MITSRIQQSGFTLTEALVSIAILSIGFVGMYSALAAAERSLGKTFELYSLTHSANSVIEDANTDRENAVAIEGLPLAQPVSIVPGKENESRRLERERKKWEKLFKKNKLEALPVKNKEMDLDDNGVIDTIDSQKIVIEMAGKQGASVKFERIHRAAGDGQ